MAPLVIPAKAGIQAKGAHGSSISRRFLDSRFRGNDERDTFPG
jgi:hypothetical protein